MKFFLGALTFLFVAIVPTFSKGDPSLPSAGTTLIDCPIVREVLSENIVEWMSAGNQFHEKSDELGWLDWTPQLQSEIGFPSAAGYSWMSALKDAKVRLSEHYRYDYLVWQSIDMNGDHVEDRLVLTSFLSGNRGEYHYGHDVFLFCGAKNSLDGSTNFRACGNFGYWAGTVRVGNFDSRVSIKRLETFVRGPETSFSILELGESRYLLATAMGWRSDTDFNLAADLWMMNQEERVRVSSCSWE
jgi:hypothetical protein